MIVVDQFKYGQTATIRNYELFDPSPIDWNTGYNSEGVSYLPGQQYLMSADLYLYGQYNDAYVNYHYFDNTVDKWQTRFGSVIAIGNYLSNDIKRRNFACWLHDGKQAFPQQLILLTSYSLELFPSCMTKVEMSFDKNTGSGSEIEPLTGNFNEYMEKNGKYIETVRELFDVNLPICTYEKIGYAFNGWKVQNHVYFPGQTCSISTDVTAYAQWKEKESFQQSKALDNKLAINDISENVKVSYKLNIAKYDNRFGSVIVSDTAKQNVKRVEICPAIGCKLIEVCGILRKNEEILSFDYVFSSKKSQEKTLSVVFGFDDDSTVVFMKDGSFEKINVTNGILTRSMLTSSSSAENYNICRIIVGKNVRTLACQNNIGTFQGFKCLKEIQFNGKIQVLEKNVFHDCKVLVFPNCQLSSWFEGSDMPEFAFCNCKDISCIDFNGSNVKRLGKHVFSGCKNLMSIGNAPNCIQEIGDYAFSNCNLVQFNAPIDLSAMHDNIFYRNYSPLSVNFNSCNNIPKIGRHTFDNIPANSEFYFNDERQMKYALRQLNWHNCLQFFKEYNKDMFQTTVFVNARIDEKVKQLYDIMIQLQLSTKFNGSMPENEIKKRISWNDSNLGKSTTKITVENKKNSCFITHCLKLNDELKDKQLYFSFQIKFDIFDSIQCYNAKSKTFDIYSNIDFLNSVVKNITVANGKNIHNII